jgi:hypothetical protein
MTATQANGCERFNVNQCDNSHLGQDCSAICSQKPKSSQENPVNEDNDSIARMFAQFKQKGWALYCKLISEGCERIWLHVPSLIMSSAIILLWLILGHQFIARLCLNLLSDLICIPCMVLFISALSRCPPPLTRGSLKFISALWGWVCPAMPWDTQPVYMKELGDLPLRFQTFPTEWNTLHFGLAVDISGTEGAF